MAKCDRCPGIFCEDITDKTRKVSNNQGGSREYFGTTAECEVAEQDSEHKAIFVIRAGWPHLAQTGNQ